MSLLTCVERFSWFSRGRDIPPMGHGLSCGFTHRSPHRGVHKFCTYALRGKGRVGPKCEIALRLSQLCVNLFTKRGDMKTPKNMFMPTYFKDAPSSVSAGLHVVERRFSERYIPGNPHHDGGKKPNPGHSQVTYK